MRKSTIEILRPYISVYIIDFIKKLKYKWDIIKWEKAGYPSPPPHIIKQNAVRDYQKIYNYVTLVETGTFKGAMVDAQKKTFGKVISIELSVPLFELAQKRFQKDKNVIIIQGDSGKILPEIIKELTNPAIFWLDGHYSAGITAKGDKECPIYEEINAILSYNQLNHILLIDDARCFIGKNDYPTIEELTNFIREKDSRYQLEIKDDIIRYVIPS